MLVRTAVQYNPEWYSKLTRLLPKKKVRNDCRKNKTSMNKFNIIKVLRWMIKNDKSRSKYTEHLLDIAQQKFDDYYADPDNIDWQQQMYE